MSICTKLDDGDYNETQEYVEKVSQLSYHLLKKRLISILVTFQTVAKMQLVTLFMNGLPPTIFALFLGPWSDQCGRKFLLIMPLFGFALYNIWFLINVKFYYSFAAEFLMAESIQFVFGGFQCIFLGFYSYISDISTEDNRTVRIAIVDFFYFVGFSMGTGK